MGYFRFHRSIGNKFFRLNFSKRGMSITQGIPGLHINVPLSLKRRSMLTLGLPGSGLSYRQPLGRGRRRTTSGYDLISVLLGWLIIGAVLYWLFS